MQLVCALLQESVVFYFTFFYIHSFVHSSYIYSVIMIYYLIFFYIPFNHMIIIIIIAIYIPDSNIALAQIHTGCCLRYSYP